MAKNYENLDVWKSSIVLNKDIYLITQDFPKEELYGLTSQIRRASVSVASNIAEGAGRASKPDFSRFINISLGSLNEVESLLFIARELKYLNSNKFNELKGSIEKLGAGLGAFKKYLSKE
ncbi:MAG: four helix bundle protein [Patescibacteria group bacterium]|jgi:four helix bundle protein